MGVCARLSELCANYGESHEHARIGHNGWVARGAGFGDTIWTR